MRRDSWLALLAGAGTLMVHSMACAQTPVGPPEGEQSAAGPEDLAEIVVTGSRVITNGNNSPTPLTVVDAQQLLAVNPGTISDALNTLPVFSGSNGLVSNPNPGIGSGGGGNGARNSLNLRNLGEARTLELLDGHRVPSTTSTNVVDADMIPQLLLKRVDVVTGGVSAVYGSDAISGVINFITDRAFNGVKAQAQYGISAKNDDAQYEAGIAGGMSVTPQLHIEGSYEFHDDQGIPYRSSRPQFAWCGMLGNGTNIPYFLNCNARRFDATFGGLIKSGAFANQQFVSPAGTLAAFNAGQAQSVTGLSNVAIGGDGAWLDASLKSSLRSHQLFGRVDYDFTDRMHGYVELAGNKKRNGFDAGWLTIGTNAQISLANAYLPANIRNAASTSTFNFGKFVGGNTRLNPVVDESQIFVMTGLEGKLGQYDWNLGVVHGDAKLDDTHYNNVNNWNLAAALDAVKDSSGNTVCRVTLTNPSQFPGCVPINVFGPGSESPQALAYVTGNTHYNAKTKQDEVSGSISGAPLNTWAGPLTTALSAEWRKQTFSSTSDMPPVDPTVPVNCAAMGLRPTGGPVNCTATTSQWGTTFANRSAVSQTVSEGAIEVEVPLIKEVTFFKELNFNGAARYTHYDTSGSSTTWKAGLDWHVNDSWRLRATRSRDIRAPTLDDLFAPSVGTPQNITDLLLVNVPGANSNSQAPRFQYGNPNLVAEVGHTETFGVVWQPQFLRGFSASLDGYDIEITNAITSTAGTDQGVQRTCYASGGTSPYCLLQTRTLGNFSAVAANVVTAWATTVFNIADVHTWGADFELNYATELGSHPLGLRGLLTWQPHIKYVRPGLPTVDEGGASYGFGGLQASPSTRATVAVRYGITERLTIDWQTRWRNSMSMIGDPSVTTTGQAVPSVTFTNLNLDYRMAALAGTLDVFLNVQNLFNTVPPPANFYGTASNTGQFGGFAVGDDPVGRYYTVGARYKF